MVKVKSFSEFINESWDDINPDLRKNTAGVAVLYDGKILLVHPANGTWQRGICGIPKGGMEQGEGPIAAAIRELKEETGIEVTKDQLDPEPQVVQIYNKKGKNDKQLIYFICRINDLSEVGLNDIKIPKEQLQLEEIDWAKFVDRNEAYPIMSRAQLIILDRLL